MEEKVPRAAGSENIHHVQGAMYTISDVEYMSNLAIS